MSDVTDRHEPDDDEARIGPEEYPETTRLPSLSRIKGMDVCDEAGDRIGKVSDVLLDAEARYVRYLVVGTGMMGRSKGAIPVDEVRYVDDEGDPYIMVPYSREHLAAAPVLDDDHELTPEREHAIYEHYRRAGYWEDTRRAVRDRQTVPAPTPRIAEAEAVADMDRRMAADAEAGNDAPRVRRLER